jgi:hypothetical protein
MRPEAYSIERRSERRPSHRAMVLVFDEQESGDRLSEAALAMDESEMGARVQSKAQLKAGQVIELQSEDKSMHLRCRVVWTGEVSSDHEGEAGLEFLIPRDM